MSCRLHTRFISAGLRFQLVCMIAGGVSAGADAKYSFDSGQRFIKTYCAGCHMGKTPAGGFNIAALNTQTSFRDKPDAWNSFLMRVRSGEMPPKAAPAPTMDAREAAVSWVQESLKAEACSAGISPGRAPIRRLSRAQYAASIRDLLNLHVDVAGGLPADGAGGEGFDNAAETLFLSPIHAEKYLDAAKLALTYAAKDPRSRAKFLIAKPEPGVTPQAAARTILNDFLPRAFRRPVAESDLAFYLDLFQSAQKRRESFEDSVLYSLRGVLVSPEFLFRSEAPNTSSQMKPLDDYALASRLSYFLWGSMPDGLLFALAEEGKLHDPEILKGQVARMLRNQKSFDFVESFVEQWLRTRDLGQSFRPDAELFPMWNDAELQGDIRYQPVLFFREILANNLSLLNLVDSKFTIATRKLQKLYGLNVKPPRPDHQQQPQRIELPEGSNRGGLLGMAAVLAISSHPQRTSPVLRGKWLLDSILGTPPPPPPPNVPALEEGPAATAHTLRERLSQHRANPACASCHSRIDPLGFALENYDVIGRWRTEEAGKPIDAKGELPDGTTFEGPDQLKAVLLEKKGLFIRNLTNKILGYALGRGLTLQDSCTVDSIIAEVEHSDYSAQALIDAVVMSAPFRFQMGTGTPTSLSKLKQTAHNTENQTESERKKL
jgi:mono/diheme cytochrome c family protein